MITVRKSGVLVFAKRCTKIETQSFHKKKNPPENEQHVKTSLLGTVV